MIILALMIFISCGDKEEKVDLKKYDGWKEYTYGHFNYHVDPHSIWAGRMGELAKGYERYLSELCMMLDMDVPEDKIEFFIYVPGPRADSLAGRPIPFSTDKTIHWGGLYPYGYELTKYLLARKGLEPGRFDVVNEGVPNLLDFSGLNYHDKTNRLVNSGQFVSLQSLGDNAVFDSIPFSTRRAESASLCGFIMYDYGLDRLFMLWNSSTDWKRSIETIFQQPIDDFEKMWLDFARGNSADPEGTVENDTIKDMRIYYNER